VRGGRTARFFAFASAFFLASPAMAEEDVHAWGAATATVRAGDKMVVWLEGQTRFYDEASRLGQVLLRPGIGYKVSRNATLFAGYAYVFTDTPGPGTTTEHRIWQQALVTIAGNGKTTTLTSRSRLEQRFMAGAGDTGLRLRQMLRLTVPVTDRGVQAVGWSETFLGLNDTDWGQRAGFDRMRNFVGVSAPISKSARIEPGYMNEYVDATDRTHHIASLTVNLNF
jgi:hypothetical protein